MSGQPGSLVHLSKALERKVGSETHRRLRRLLLPVYSRIPRFHWSQCGEDVILGELLPEQRGSSRCSTTSPWESRAA